MTLLLRIPLPFSRFYDTVTLYHFFNADISNQELFKTQNTLMFLAVHLFVYYMLIMHSQKKSELFEFLCFSDWNFEFNFSLLVYLIILLAGDPSQSDVIVARGILSLGPVAKRRDCC